MCSQTGVRDPGRHVDRLPPRPSVGYRSLAPLPPRCFIPQVLLKISAEGIPCVGLFGDAWPGGKGGGGGVRSSSTPDEVSEVFGFGFFRKGELSVSVSRVVFLLVFSSFLFSSSRSRCSSFFSLIIILVLVISYLVCMQLLPFSIRIASGS